MHVHEHGFAGRLRTIRKEFGGDTEAYAAYLSAVERGAVKIKDSRLE